MTFKFTIGRLIIFDFTLFEIRDEESEDTVIVRHHYVNDEDETNGDGPDLFGNK